MVMYLEPTMLADVIASSLLIPNTFRGVLSAKLFDQRLSFARDLVGELNAKNNKLPSEKNLRLFFPQN